MLLITEIKNGIRCQILKDSLLLVKFSVIRAPKYSFLGAALFANLGFVKKFRICKPLNILVAHRN
jgi:hypothetical protein